MINFSKLIASFFTFVGLFFFLPVTALAQETPKGPEDFNAFVKVLLSIIEPLVVVLIGLSLVVFIWGLAKFILKAGDEKEREAGKRLIIWGIIGLFVMTSVWGILQILVGDLLGSGFFGKPLLPT